MISFWKRNIEKKNDLKWKFRETHLEVNKELIFDICGNKVILSQNKNIQIVYEKECFDKFILNWFLF